MKTAKPCNDNSLWRRRYMGTDYNGPMVRFLEHVPVAQRLIRSYCKEAWKHAPEHREYAAMEYYLCTYLEHPEHNASHRRLKIAGIASVLEYSPVVFYNDPHLPF